MPEDSAGGDTTPRLEADDTERNDADRQSNKRSKRGEYVPKAWYQMSTTIT